MASLGYKHDLVKEEKWKLWIVLNLSTINLQKIGEKRYLLGGLSPSWIHHLVNENCFPFIDLFSQPLSIKILLEDARKSSLSGMLYL